MSTKEKEAPKIPFIPYLKHPIPAPFTIAEGYIYSLEERKLHGAYWHKGIDYADSYNTPVYASAAGFAIAGYHRFIVLNRDNTLKLFNGKPMGNGYGYFVQIYHPESVCSIKGGRITQYAHLASVNGIKVKITQPIMVNHIERVSLSSQRRGESKKVLEAKKETTADLIRKYPWVNKAYGYSFSDSLESKESYLYNPNELELLLKKGNPEVKWVEAGQQIGTLGISAVFAGKPNYREGDINPEIKEPENNWDEVHLHFEEGERDWETGWKKQRRDPYDIYKSVIWYKPSQIKRSLFIDNPYHSKDNEKA